MCSRDLNEWFGKEWIGIEQVFRLQRRTQMLATGQVREEMIYGLSSLSQQEAPPKRLLALIRDQQ